VHDPESLNKFYRDTLKTMPSEVLNKHLYRFRFTVDSSLLNPNGTYRNPNLGRFLADNGRSWPRMEFIRCMRSPSAWSPASGVRNPTWSTRRQKRMGLLPGAGAPVRLAPGYVF